MSDREQVEAYWEWAKVYPPHEDAICFCVCFGDGKWGTRTIDGDSEPAAWSAALAFTEEHKHKAIELKREITVQAVLFEIAAPDFHEDMIRTKSRLEAALAQHMIGVKGVAR